MLKSCRFTRAREKRVNTVETLRPLQWPPTAPPLSRSCEPLALSLRAHAQTLSSAKSERRGPYVTKGEGSKKRRRRTRRRRTRRHVTGPRTWTPGVEEAAGRLGGTGDTVCSEKVRRLTRAHQHKCDGSGKLFNTPPHFFFF